MPLHDVTLATGVASSKVSALIRSDSVCRASVDVHDADDPINPAQLFSRDYSPSDAMLRKRCAVGAQSSLWIEMWSKGYEITRDVIDRRCWSRRWELRLQRSAAASIRDTKCTPQVPRH